MEAPIALALGSVAVCMLIGSDPGRRASPEDCAFAHSLCERRSLRCAADPTASFEFRCGNPFLGVPVLPGDPCSGIRAKLSRPGTSVTRPEYLADAYFHAGMKRYYRPQARPGS